jgi:hypothetical protein
MAAEQDEPSLQPEPTPAEGRLTQLLERAESLLISAVALFLVALVLLSLLAAIWEVKDALLIQRDFTAATLKGVNATFLSIILLELPHDAQPWSDQPAAAGIPGDRDHRHGAPRAGHRGHARGAAGHHAQSRDQRGRGAAVGDQLVAPAEPAPRRESSSPTSDG